MPLVVTRLRYARRGFRAKLSDGWFVYDDTARRPVAGPFVNKSDARMERDRLKEEGRVMDKKIQESRSVEEVIERKGTDQSDSPSAKDTNDGSSPSDGREEEVIERTRTRSTSDEG